MPAYDVIFGRGRDSLPPEAIGFEPGSPERAADVLVQVVRAPDPPGRLQLGAMAVELAHEVARRRLEEAARWGDIGRRADYDAAVSNHELV
jgi:hypothetical protein